MKTFAASARDANQISSLSVFTLVIWFGCLLVGGLGFTLPYARPRPPQPQREPVKMEMIDVKLTAAAQPVPESSDNSPATESTPPAEQIPQPIPVARPSPAIAFAIPVKGPVRVVAASHAAYTQPSAPVVTAAPKSETLTFGEGEGRQPAPEYPERARRAGQEGDVTAAFIIGEDGHVVSVKATVPSQWPLLNQSVVRTIKQEWRFAPGKLRARIIVIRFELSKEF